MSDGSGCPTLNMRERRRVIKIEHKNTPYMVALCRDSSRRYTLYEGEVIKIEHKTHHIWW